MRRKADHKRTLQLVGECPEAEVAVSGRFPIEKAYFWLKQVQMLLKKAIAAL
jgi:hypothetical protein